MNRLKHLFAVLLVVIFTAAASFAQVTFELVTVPIPPGTQIVDGILFPAGTPGPVLGTLDGYKCQDLVVETTQDWTIAAMLIELSNGSIYQELEGIVAAEGGYKFYNGQTTKLPDATLFPTLPSSQYDTYVHGNGLQASFNGAAGDVGGDGLQFDATQIDAAWSGPFESTDDIGSVALGRFTLTGDAAGIWRLVITQKGDLNGIVVTGTVVNGELQFDP